MRRIEVTARELLLSRRSSLARAAAPAPADPARSWVDWEALSEEHSRQRQAELEEIEAALQRIEQGRYGSCQACGGPVGLQRLRAIPEARFCLGCSGQRDGDL